MPSQSDINRRKLLRKEAENSIRVEEEAHMPISRPQLSALFHDLDVALKDGCDHTLSFTVAYLRSHGLSETLIIPWLQKQGGYCDCEVLANVEERWGQL